MLKTTIHQIREQLTIMLLTVQDDPPKLNEVEFKRFRGAILQATVLLNKLEHLCK
jgi:hypothetical protein